MFTTVLMIEKPLAAADIDLVTTLHGEEPVSFVVLMQPRGDQDRLLRAVDDVALGYLDDAAHEAEVPEGDDARPPAERALTHSLQALRAAGAQAVGEVVGRRPLDRLRAVVAETHADEVIVLTAPHFVEEFFHRDWTSRARHKVGVPVLKLFAQHDAYGDGAAPGGGTDGASGGSGGTGGASGSGGTGGSGGGGRTAGPGGTSSGSTAPGGGAGGSRDDDGRAQDARG